MSIYRAKNGQWTGSQLAADQANPDSPKGSWTEHGLPTSKEATLALLNEFAGEAPEAFIVTPETGKSPETSERLEQVEHDIAVEEEIGRADLPRTICLVEHCASRLLEHSMKIDAKAKEQLS